MENLVWILWSFIIFTVLMLLVGSFIAACWWAYRRYKAKHSRQRLTAERFSHVFFGKAHNFIAFNKQGTVRVGDLSTYTFSDYPVSDVNPHEWQWVYHGTQKRQNTFVLYINDPDYPIHKLYYRDDVRKAEYEWAKLQAVFTGELSLQDYQQDIRGSGTELPEKISVLFVASNPTDQTQLRLDEEIRAVTGKIRESKYRDSVELKAVWATRPSDLLQALNEHKPTVVHFSGHGSKRNDIFLQDGMGLTRPVSKTAVVEMFKVEANELQLVVFNTCFSDIQANKITKYIPITIGMNTSISDEAARTFAAQLYSAIGFGKSVQTAFHQAKVALLLENIPGTIK